jgi:pimeloyl-ACP methyl ester carboxylesterase
LRQDAGEVVRNFARQCLAPGESAWADEVAACFSAPGDIDLLASGLDYLMHRDLRSLLPQVAEGCVIIQGDHDAIVPWEQGEFLQTHLSGATLKRMPGGGHVPFVTQSDAVNAVLEGVLGGHETF